MDKNLISFELLRDFHCDSIKSICTSELQPLAMSCDFDSIRVLNIQQCILELSKRFFKTVYCISIHPYGLHLLAGFVDQINLYEIIDGDIHHLKSFSIGFKYFLGFWLIDS